MNDFQNQGLNFNPQDISKTLENALHLYRGNHDKLPELLKDAGTLLLKFSKKLSTPQLILAVGIVACGVALVAVNIAKQEEEDQRKQAGGQTIDISSPGNAPGNRTSPGQNNAV